MMEKLIIFDTTLRKDGTVALTANWDVGAFDVRAQNLTSDALAAGRVLFTGTAGLLSVDAGVVWDNTGKQLGVGPSVSPDKRLLVTSPTAAATEYMVGIEQTNQNRGVQLGVYTGMAAIQGYAPSNDSAQDLALNPAGGCVGVGIAASLLGMLHVDQSSTSGAIPPLVIDQADLSEEMIKFITTIGEGNPIEAKGAKTLTVTHFIRYEIPGPAYVYVEAGTIA